MVAQHVGDRVVDLRVDGGARRVGIEALREHAAPVVEPRQDHHGAHHQRRQRRPGERSAHEPRAQRGGEEQQPCRQPDEARPRLRQCQHPGQADREAGQRQRPPAHRLGGERQHDHDRDREHHADVVRVVRQRRDAVDRLADHGAVRLRHGHRGVEVQARRRRAGEERVDQVAVEVHVEARAEHVLHDAVQRVRAEPGDERRQRAPVERRAAPRQVHDRRDRDREPQRPDHEPLRQLPPVGREHGSRQVYGQQPGADQHQRPRLARDPRPTQRHGCDEQRRQ